MKKTVLVWIFCVFAASARADIGVTAAVGGSTDIRLPVRQGDWIVEPFLSHSISRRRDNRGEYLSYQKFTNDSTSVGFGVWKVTDVRASVFFQYGVQLGYVRETDDSAYVQTYEGVEEYGQHFESTLEGYRVIPGMGLFYHFNEAFDVGVELKYAYQSVSGKERFESIDYYDSFEETSESRDREETYTGTLSNIFIRFFF